IDAVMSQGVQDLLGLYRDAADGICDPVDHLRRLVEASFRNIQNHPDAAIVYQAERNYLMSLPILSYLETARGEVDAIWLGVIRAGMASGQFRADVDPMLFYRLAAYPIWVTAAASAASGRSPEEL